MGGLIPPEKVCGFHILFLRGANEYEGPGYQADSTWDLLPGK